ncbi:ATP-binding protein [Actinomadura formosensis]|uniref:ATP-binding protein n=1 Tax=Actinomadura formosensis TaxID=60706 RepID=UPI000ADF7054|nr:ATP-binding protein [Actinomadura formosensis]
MTKAATMRGIPWRLENGGCAALPLPADESIARVARAHVTELLPALGLSIQDVDDITLMVSELATNVLQHATSREGASGAELWVYQRTDGSGRDELVVKAFDTLRGWRPQEDAGRPMLEHGRGLEIIDLLTRGRWGHHPSRSRLRTPAVRGKATWIALPLPRSARRRRHAWRRDEPHATKDLHALLVQRGVEHLSPRDELGVRVLSGNGDLTVWCEAATFRWHARTGETGRLPIADITEVCEELVRLHECMND